jgi:hypothetical protein
VVRAFARLVPRLQDSDRTYFAEALDAALPAIIQHAEPPSLRHALQELEDVMSEAGHETARLAGVRSLLAESSRRLMPKPPDEPEAAHPQ